MNTTGFINNTCDACGRRNVSSTRRFSAMRLCSRCYEMLAPVDTHYGRFMW